MTRAAIVTYDFYPPIGGQGRHTYELWRRLRETPGLDLHVLSPLRNELPGHRRVLPATLRFGKHILFSAAMTARISRWQRDLRLDVVHLNGGPGGLFLLRRPAGGTVIYTVHHTYAQQSRLVPGEGWKRVFVPVERSSYKKGDIVTGDCASTTRTVQEELGVPSAITVPSGVDTKRFRPLDIERVASSMLYVGRLDRRKGIEHIVRAMPAILDRVPDATLYVIGRGPLEPTLRQLAREGGYEDQVVYLGQVSEEDLVAWYNRAALVVVPSAFEGFGLAVLEAQACGTPVLATDTDGLRDLIEDGRTGKLAPYGEAEALGRIAGELLCDSEARRALADGGYHEAQQFDWDRVVEQWRNVYSLPARSGSHVA